MGNSNSTPNSSTSQEKKFLQKELNQDLKNSHEKKKDFLDLFKKSNLLSSKNDDENFNDIVKQNDKDKSKFFEKEFKNSLDEKTIRNPGTNEDLSKACTDLFPIGFEGCRIIFNKALSNNFQVSHTFNMSNPFQSGYRFGATYVGTKLISPVEAYPIFLGDIDPFGNLNASIIHQVFPRIKAKFVAQFSDFKCNGIQATTDYKGNSYTLSCTLANVDIVNKSGIVVGHYLKNITPKLDLGVELIYQKFSPILRGGLGLGIALSFVGRYKTPEYILTGGLQTNGFNLRYYKKIQENFQAGVELNTNIQESVASFGYQLNIPKVDVNFKGSFNSNLQICGVLEKKLQPLPFTFLLSGQVDHSAREPNYKFGIGLMIGSN